MIRFEFFKKAKAKIWAKIVQKTYGKTFYNQLYSSYWNYKFASKKSASSNHINYLSAVPNPGAGIGHQMANWIAGLWYSKKFGVEFAHIPFSAPVWEKFLGFGENTPHVDLLLREGYSKVTLPLFDEYKDAEVTLVKNIIKSYSNKKVVFIAEQDQFFEAQYPVMELLKEKFYAAKERANDKLIYSKEFFNIAIHIRRGDITVNDGNPNLIMRWQDQDYFENVLSNAIKALETSKPLAIYLFSQGDPNDFSEFGKFSNLRLCLNMSAKDSFLHMVFADLLISSKSSFSYKPALLNKNIKLCPDDFWHGYPVTSDFILADKRGNFHIDKLKV